MKKYKKDIKSRILRKLILMLLLVMARSLVTNFYTNTNNKSLLSRRPDIIYQVYTVKYNDTLWEIADKIKGDRKRENIIQQIKYVNSIGELIMPGQDLLIPIEHKNLTIVK